MDSGDELAARAAISDLVAAYCDAVTRADPTDFGACWATDAVWIVPGTGELVGRDAIVEQFTRTRAMYDFCLQELLSGRVLVHADGRQAEGRWYVRELQHTEDRVGGELLGAYDDRIARENDGAWRFRRRAFQLLYRGRLEMPGRFYRLPPRWPPSADGSSEHS